MNFPYYIAKKYFGNYLFSYKKSKNKRSLNAIQILTLISITTAIIVSAATVIVLSVFNGLTVLLGSLNEIFYPDLKVEPKTGKVFPMSQEALDQLSGVYGVAGVSEVLEELALLEYNDKQVMAKVKGVDSLYSQVSDIEQSMFGDHSQFILQNEHDNFAVVGLGIANQLNLRWRDPLTTLTIYVPQRKRRFVISPSASLGVLPLKVSGEFSIQQEFDNQYAFVPISALRPLLQYENEVSYLEVRLNPGANEKQVRKDILEQLGPDVEIKNREEQNESWYKVMRFEKWMSFAILLLIMFIASFNLLSSLTMMVLDKQKDIGILKSMGLEDRASSQIIRWQGLLIGLSGAFIGAGIASILVLLQQTFGFIPLEGSFVVDSYPIQLHFFDVFLTVISVVLISWLASIYPSLRVYQQTVQESI